MEEYKKRGEIFKEEFTPVGKEERQGLAHLITVKAWVTDITPFVTFDENGKTIPVGKTGGTTPPQIIQLATLAATQSQWVKKECPMVISVKDGKLFVSADRLMEVELKISAQNQKSDYTFLYFGRNEFYVDKWGIIDAEDFVIKVACLARGNIEFAITLYRVMVGLDHPRKMIKYL